MDPACDLFALDHKFMSVKILITRPMSRMLHYLCNYFNELYSDRNNTRSQWELE